MNENNGYEPSVDCKLKEIIKLAEETAKAAELAIKLNDESYDEEYRNYDDYEDRIKELENNSVNQEKVISDLRDEKRKLSIDKEVLSKDLYREQIWNYIFMFVLIASSLSHFASAYIK